MILELSLKYMFTGAIIFSQLPLLIFYLFHTEKVTWTFSPAISGTKRGLGGNVAAYVKWLGSLDPPAVRELILSRALMVNTI